MEDKKLLGPDGKEIKKPEVEKKVVDIQEDIKTKIDEKRVARKNLTDEFINISLKRAMIIKREQEIMDLLKSNADSINAKISFAYKKLRLDKDVEYAYQYSADGKFIGTPKKKA